MKKMIQFLTRLFRRSKPSSPVDSVSPRMAQMVAGMVAHTAEFELTCDEVFELLDQFAEMARRGENDAELMPLVNDHLAMCPECREEYEALQRILDHM
jgi:hypothetical protein